MTNQLLKEILEKTDKIGSLYSEFCEKDLKKINQGKFKYTIHALNKLLVKIGYLNSAIINSYAAENFYAIKILNRTLLEAYFKHLYIYSRSLKENSDDVGIEYVKNLKAAEDLSAMKFLFNFSKETSLILSENQAEWSFGGEHNKKIEETGKKFDLKQICNYLLKNIDKDKEMVAYFFREDFFRKYIKEYSNGSSFVHAGRYSDEVLGAFQSSDKKRVLNQMLEESFSLYEFSLINTYLFYSLQDESLKKYYERVKDIFTVNKNII